MGSCVAYNCTNRTSKKLPGITFHCFPKEESRRQLWINAVRRENWKPTYASKLCSVHFPEEMIDRTSVSCVRLKENAVPSIFDFPSHLQKQIKPARKPPDQVTRNFPDNQQNCKEKCASPLLHISEPLSPEKSFYKRKVKECLEKIEEKNKKIKVLQQKVRRYKQKIESLSDLISDLRDKNLMDEDSLSILETVSSVNEEFLFRQLASAKQTGMPKEYSPILRSFALTLHFFSPRAYEYVRTTFGFALPHQRTISRWYQHVDGAPGFTQEAIEVLMYKIKSSLHPLYFALIMDEMSIRQHFETDGHELHGFINLGLGNESDDGLPLAKQAFVLLLGWKICYKLLQFQFLATCCYKNSKIVIFATNCYKNVVYRHLMLI